MDKKNVSAEVSWVDREIKRFKETGNLIPVRQEKLYQKIRDHFVQGRTVLDIGCSAGVGANLLSHQARFVWGVDINEEAVRFATRAFKRPNLDFTVMDIEKPPEREMAKFEIITMLETLEHLEHPEEALNNIKRFFTPQTIAFITIPNYANEEVRSNQDKHGFHLSNWDAGAFYELLTKHFQAVVLYSVDKLEQWNQEETVDGTTTDYLIVAKIEGFK